MYPLYCGEASRLLAWVLRSPSCKLREKAHAIQEVLEVPEHTWSLETEGKLFLSVSSRLANPVNQIIDKYESR